MAGEAARTVLVGCKHPAGLILNLDHYVVVHEQSLMVRRQAGKATVTLKGTAHAFGQPSPVQGSGGYRFTSVPADFWEAWLAKNRESPFLQDRIILPPPDTGPDRQVNAVAQACEHEKVEPMYRPLDPEGDSRIGGLKSVTPKEAEKD